MTNKYRIGFVGMMLMAISMLMLSSCEGTATEQWADRINEKCPITIAGDEISKFEIEDNNVVAVINQQNTDAYQHKLEEYGEEALVGETYKAYKENADVAELFKLLDESHGKLIVRYTNDDKNVDITIDPNIQEAAQ